MEMGEALALDDPESKTNRGHKSRASVRFKPCSGSQRWPRDYSQETFPRKLKHLDLFFEVNFSMYLRLKCNKCEHKFEYKKKPKKRINSVEIHTYLKQFSLFFLYNYYFRHSK